MAHRNGPNLLGPLRRGGLQLGGTHLRATV
jgi:hypothetical protein